GLGRPVDLREGLEPVNEPRARRQVGGAEDAESDQQHRGARDERDQAGQDDKQPVEDVHADASSPPAKSSMTMSMVPTGPAPSRSTAARAACRASSASASSEPATGSAATKWISTHSAPPTGSTTTPRTTCPRPKVPVVANRPGLRPATPGTSCTAASIARATASGSSVVLAAPPSMLP